MIKHKAEKLFAKICSARNGCINLIMKAFEDVAVDFAWEILESFKLTVTTRSALSLSFDDYSKGRPVFQYPSYKTQTEITRERAKEWKTESMRDYEDKNYGYMAWPGIASTMSPYFCSKCGHTFLEKSYCPRCIDDGDPDKRKSSQRAIHYMSPEDAEYLWGCMPKWIKEVPGPEHAWDCMWFGTLFREGDLKVHNEVKRILNR